MLKWSRSYKSQSAADFNKGAGQIGGDVYVELDFTTGDIFFNLTKKYRRYVINCVNEHVAESLRSFKTANYEVYKKTCDRVFGKFGDIRTKDAYDKFKSWFNKECFGNDKCDKILRGFYFHILSNASLSSLQKFDESGFVQEWGHRSLELTEDQYEEIHTILRERAPIIVSQDPLAVHDRYSDENTLFVSSSNLELGGKVYKA